MGLAIFAVPDLYMEIVHRISELQFRLEEARKKGRQIGLVPTMGALHPGHLSLIEASENKEDFTVVSIFVNPTQFNDPRDLEKYPRTLDLDISLLQQKKVHLLFVPSVEEMYPEKDTRVFDLSPLDRVMEGKFRPGHFNGVAQIVSKLFTAVNPDRAYFGEKDFQQLAIIRKMARDLEMDIDIIGCPIIREPDGLAMSSRNQLLKPNEREAAPLINQTLTEAAEKYRSLTPGEIKDQVINTLNEHPLMQVEYFDIVDSETLESISDWDSAPNKIGCIAVHLGEVRLIDNRYFI